MSASCGSVMMDVTQEGDPSKIAEDWILSRKAQGFPLQKVKECWTVDESCSRRHESERATMQFIVGSRGTTSRCATQVAGIAGREPPLVQDSVVLKQDPGGYHTEWQGVGA